MAKRGGLCSAVAHGAGDWELNELYQGRDILSGEDILSGDHYFKIGNRQTFKKEVSYIRIYLFPLKKPKRTKVPFETFQSVLDKLIRRGFCPCLGRVVQPGWESERLRARSRLAHCKLPFPHPRVVLHNPPLRILHKDAPSLRWLV